MYFMSDPQTLHVTRNVIPVKLGVDLHLHRVHIPLVEYLLSLSELQQYLCQVALTALCFAITVDLEGHKRYYSKS